MKRSFFLALGLYLLLVGAIWTLYEPLPLPQKKAIQIANIHILKPKRCTCGCQQTQKPKNPPKKEPRQKVKPKPKIQSRPRPKPKIGPKVQSKSKVKRKIRAKKHKPKRVLKNKIAKHSTPKPKKAALVPAPKPSPPTPQKATPQKTKISQPTHPPSPSPTSSKPKPSYQHLYIQSFLDRIEAAIRRHTHYPRIARRTHQEGVVEICFTLQPSGEVTHLHILKSSGHKILDRTAQKTILQAAKEFPPPKKAVDLRIPIEYRLR